MGQSAQNCRHQIRQTFGQPSYRWRGICSTARFLLHDFIPIYVGGGVGYSHLSTGGSALTLLEAQGITVDGKKLWIDRLPTHWLRTPAT